MSWARVRVLMQKEWLEIRRNKMILLAMLLLPLTMVGIVIFSAAVIIGVDPAEMARQGFVPPAEIASLAAQEALLVIMNDQNMLYLILTPMLLPIVIGAYSIIGEKETRSLEPLLATPITTSELIVGKMLAAVTPALVIGVVQFLLAIAAIGIITPFDVFLQAIRPLWLVAILLTMPLLTALSTLLAIVVSARLSDVRAAQAVAGLVILPILAAGLSVLLGQLYLTVEVALVSSLVLALVDLGVFGLAVRVFDRERILSRIG